MIPDEIHVGDIVCVIGCNGEIPWDGDGHMESLIGGKYEVTKIKHGFQDYLELDTPLPDSRSVSWHWNPEDVELVNKAVELVEPNYNELEMLFE